MNYAIQNLQLPENVFSHCFIDIVIARTKQMSHGQLRAQFFLADY